MHNLNTSNEKIKLLGELHQNCSLVQNAIDHLMKCKKQVEENVVEVKIHINGNASSALDALRKREVQLLRQVDVMQAQHLDLLQAHHAKLHQLLGNLKQSLHCAEIGKHDATLNYCPEELELARAVRGQKITPDSIGFVGESQQLISHIESFGKISAVYNFLASQHKDDRVSRCLPSNQEDYGDCEHQLLYKTLEELTYRREENKVSEELIESPHSNEGWLINYLGPPRSTSWNRKFPVYLPEELLVKEQSFWLRVQGSSNVDNQYSASGKERHVQDWVRQLKQQPVMENVEYNLKSCTTTGRCCGETVPTESSSESIEMISMSEMSDVTGFTTVGSPNICGSNQLSWLRTVVNKEQAKQEHCHCITRENTNVDIEDYVPCSVNLSAAIPADTTNIWLAKNSDKNGANFFAVSDNTFDMVEVCCANELCRSPRDCVCVDRCTQKALQKRLGPPRDVTGDGEWIRRALSETVLVDENPKWLSAEYERLGDEKVELSEKNLKMSSLNFVPTATSVANTKLVDQCGNPSMIPGDNRNSDWLVAATPLEDGGMDCDDFLREDCKTYFQKDPMSKWLSSSRQGSTDQSDFIREDFRIYFQKGMSNCWIQN